MHNHSICMQNCNCVFFHKSGHQYFDRSGPFLQIRSQLLNNHAQYNYIT